ncbi:hemin uptake protein HemP [Citrobacter enshiensis]|uniref:hemin uptake protein HemP n=1 Tax=Citrobacter enshiensis TaxID=2971264 RepID=UPI0023E8396A|nr:hemin uptake protein HemP [Citrobacter enshiensis]WET38939.1 hemin uptake protein HemP [Citrobacter enshiensis]
MSRMDRTESPHSKEQSSVPPSNDTERRISSQTLLGQQGKVIIDHDGQEYLLRKTNAGKLLLTK